MKSFKVTQAASGRVVLQEARAAEKFLERLVGLMGRKGLAEGEGLLLPRCSSIHMLFMRFPIDVIYLDRRERVRKIVRGLKPWRISWCPGADAVLEVAAGWADRVGLNVGDELAFVPEQGQTG